MVMLNIVDFGSVRHRFALCGRSLNHLETNGPAAPWFEMGPQRNTASDVVLDAVAALLADISTTATA